MVKIATKSLQRVKKRMVKDPPMALISMRMPQHMIDELKELATAKGFADQALQAV